MGRVEKFAPTENKIKAKGSDLNKAQPRSFKWALFPQSSHALQKAQPWVQFNPFIR